MKPDMEMGTITNGLPVDFGTSYYNRPGNEHILKFSSRKRRA